MTEYRYIFGSLRAERVLAEIPLYGVNMNMEMNVGGDFQGTFELDMTGYSNRDLMDATEPGRCWVACERNGTCIWHGYIWTRTYSAQSKSMQLFAQSFEKYPEKRRILQDLSYTNVEQRNIFIDMWRLMMQANGSDINVILPIMNSFATVVPKTVDVLFSDNRYYNEVMSAIADAGNGFDWYIDPIKVGMLYQKNLLIGYPTLGVNPGPGGVVFEYPGNMTQYYYTEAMADAGTNVFVVGSGEGDTQILGVQEDTNLINSGFVRWDVNVSRTDVDDQATINSIAIQEIQRRRPPMPVIKVQVKTNLEPVFGSYNLGDICTIRIQDARFPSPGLNVQKRLLRWELTPQSSDNSEEAMLIFDGDPDV